MARQCQLLGLPRSSYYYSAQAVDDLTLTVMNLIDEEYTRHPFIGTRKMREYLRKLGYLVNRKRVQRLYREMAIEAIYPKKNLSKPSKAHKIYPYLLKGVGIVRNDQVWSTDITYIRLKQGFAYLVAIIDWYSRFVLDWQISPTLEADFCIETLQRALRDQRCEIFNTDQGSQFTCLDFTRVLLDNEIKISMDGRGRALDNIFIERLWRTVKYEYIYLRDINSMKELKSGLETYFHYYNYERLHQSLDYKTPANIYRKTG